MITLVLVTLLDGSQINMRLPSNTILDFKTAYGDLKIPISVMRECKLGVHTDSPELLKEWCNQLASSGFRERDAASKSLRHHHRQAYQFILPLKNSPNEEVKRRVELLLREYTSPPQLHDNLVTDDAALSGQIHQSVLRGESTSLGPLEIRLSQITSLYFSVPKVTLTINPGGWVEVGRIGGRLKITATGEIDLWAQTPGQYMARPKANNGGHMHDGFPAGSLLGRVGGGAAFLVGDSFAASDMARGKLELRINGSPWPNTAQTGSYSVEVVNE